METITSQDLGKELHLVCSQDGLRLTPSSVAYLIRQCMVRWTIATKREVNEYIRQVETEMGLEQSAHDNVWSLLTSLGELVDVRMSNQDKLQYRRDYAGFRSTSFRSTSDEARSCFMIGRSVNVRVGTRAMTLGCRVWEQIQPVESENLNSVVRWVEHGLGDESLKDWLGSHIGEFEDCDALWRHWIGKVNQTTDQIGNLDLYNIIEQKPGSYFGRMDDRDSRTRITALTDAEFGYHLGLRLSDHGNQPVLIWHTGTATKVVLLDSYDTLCCLLFKQANKNGSPEVFELQGKQIRLSTLVPSDIRNVLRYCSEAQEGWTYTFIDGETAHDIASALEWKYGLKKL